MKTKLRPPPYTIPTIGQRAYTYSNNQTGNLASTLRRRRSRALSWPSVPPFAPPWQHPLDSNRAFCRWIRTAWRNTLSTANRAAWDSLAAVTPFQNFKLTVKYSVGFFLFQYYHHAWRGFYYTPGAPFHPETSAPDLEPYLPWTPPDPPDTFSIVEQYPTGIKVRYNAYVPDIDQLLVTQVATKRSKRNPTLSTAFVNLPVPLLYYFFPPITYECVLNWQGLISCPPELGPRVFRFRTLDMAPTYTPSYRRKVTLTLL